MTNFALGNIYIKSRNDLNRSIYNLNNAMNLGYNAVDLYNNLSFTYFITKQ